MPFAAENWKVPAGHTKLLLEMHEILPASGWYVPVGHGWHGVAGFSSVSTVPGAHFVQTLSEVRVGAVSS